MLIPQLNYTPEADRTFLAMQLQKQSIAACLHTAVLTSFLGFEWIYGWNDTVQKDNSTQRVCVV